LEYDKEKKMEKEKCKSVIVDGKEYIPKGSSPEMADNYVIVRTCSAGVHAGELVERNGKEVTLKNARRIWYWDGAATLSQLAMEGTKTPDKCKFPREVKEIILTEATEIIPCTEKAQRSIKEVKIWKR